MSDVKQEFVLVVTCNACGWQGAPDGYDAHVVTTQHTLAVLMRAEAALAVARRAHEEALRTVPR